MNPAIVAIMEKHIVSLEQFQNFEQHLTMYMTLL